MIRLIIIVLLTVFSFVSSSRAEVTPEKRAEIEKMLRLTGMENLMNQMKTNLITTLKPTAPRLKDSFWTKFEAKLDIRDLIEQIIPVYDKYYTLEDLKVVNAFYETPTGKKVVATLPQIMQESSKIGQAWGAKIGRQIEDESERATNEK